jgi:hypothetical protein
LNSPLGLHLIYPIFGLYRQRETIRGQAGAGKEYIFKYQDEVMCGDYNNLLCVTMDYVHVT